MPRKRKPVAPAGSQPGSEAPDDPASSPAGASLTSPDPVSEAFGGLFALTPAAAVLDPAEMIPRMESAIGQLGRVSECRDAARRALQAALSRCLVGLQLTRGRCKDCIDDAMQAALKRARTCCGNNKDCIERAMVNALTDAWAIAERYGCSLPGSSPQPAPGPPGVPSPPPSASPPIVAYSPSRITVYSPILGADGMPYPVQAAGYELGAVEAGAGSMDRPPIAPGMAFAGPGAGFWTPPTQDCVLWVKRPDGGWNQYLFAQAGVIEWPPGEVPYTRGMRAPRNMTAAERARFAGDIARCGVQGGISPPIAPPKPPGGSPTPGPSPIIGPAPPPPTCPTEPSCPEPEPREWRAWRSVLDDTCYVTGPGVAPRNRRDPLLYQGKSRPDAERAAHDYCDDAGGKPKPPHPKPKRVIGPDWCDPDLCERLPGIGKALEQFVPGSILKMLGIDLTEPGDGNFLTDLFKKPWAKITKTVFDTFLAVAHPILGAGYDVARAVAPCNDPLYPALIGLRSLLGFAQTFVGASFADVQQSYDYWARYLCPTQIPTAEGARAAYYANAIDIHQLECWVRANNQCWEPFQTLIEAGRSKPTPLELSFMRRRGWIDDTALDAGYRRLGYLDPADRAMIHGLTEQVPVMSDIIRFMARDADDAALVAKFGMDDLFDAKYQQQLRAWSEAQGVTEQQARYSWRAHWSIPSPSQLYTFYHRFRNEPKYWQGQNPRDVIKEALVQQDILPFWQEAFIDASFLPINRSDAIAAYDVGVLDEVQLADAFGKVGYDDATAQTLVESRRVFRRKRMRSDRWARLYRNGGASRQAAEANLSALGYSADSIQIVLDEALAFARAESRAKCVIGVKRRLMRGEFTPPEAEAELVKQGVDIDQANALASGWACERAAKGKQASAGVLAQWFELGLLDLGDMIDRLERLGYSRQDASMVALGILNRIDQRQTKATEAAQRKAEQAQARAERAAERMARKNAQAIKNMEKQQQARRLARERREKTIIEAGITLARKTGVQIYESVAELRRLIALAQKAAGQSQDDAIEAAVVAVEAYAKGEPLSGLESVYMSSLAAQDDIQSDQLDG